MVNDNFLNDVRTCAAELKLSFFFNYNPQARILTNVKTSLEQSKLEISSFFFLVFLKIKCNLLFESRIMIDTLFLVTKVITLYQTTLWTPINQCKF